MEFKKTRKHRPVQQPARVPEQQTEPDDTAVEKSRAVLSRTVKRIIWATAVAIVLTVVIAVVYSVVSSRLASSPSFQAILPDSKSINVLGGWTRISPPGDPQAFAYSDSIDSVIIRVSEQELPTTSSVTDIAKGYNATDKITAGKTTVYIGNNFKGSQSVIFAKNGLLILIGSASTINNDAWASYIDSLQ